VFIALSASEARTVFKTAARELSEMHGVAWCNRFIEGRDRYEIDRFVLTVEDARWSWRSPFQPPRGARSRVAGRSGRRTKPRSGRGKLRA